MLDDVWSLTSYVISVNLLMWNAAGPRNDLAQTVRTFFLTEQRMDVLVARSSLHSTAAN